MDKALADRIAANREMYYRLMSDGNYIDVRFNPQNGALSAIHKNHNFDPTIGKFGIPRGDYERISLEVLYEYGKSVILESEKPNNNKQKINKFSEGFLDGKRFDIKGVEGTGGRNVIDKISEAGRQGAESVVLYYHCAYMFDLMKIINAYNGYLKLSTTKRVKNVYYIVDNKLYKIEHKKNASDKSLA